MSVRYTRSLLLGLLVVVAALTAIVAGVPVRAAEVTTSTAPPVLECEEVTSNEELTIRYCRPADETSETSTFPLRVEVQNTRSVVGDDPTVTRIDLAITTTLADQVAPDPPTKPWTGSSRTAVLEWEPRFTTNGPYDLRIDARGGDRFIPQAAAATVTMRLAAPPRAPTGVKVAKVDDGSVLISWSSDERERDVLSYEVRRAAEGATTFERVGTTEAADKPQYVDDPGVGSWRYRVVALRRGASSDTVVESSSSVQTVDVVAPTSGADADDPATGDTATTLAGASGGSGSSTSTSPSTTARPAVTAGSRPGVALGTITTTAGGGRVVTTVRRGEPDPGFEETLPFDVPPRSPEALPEEEPLEPGTDDQAAGEELIADDAGDRRRSLGFVAGGLLLFVLGMTGLFLKAEVRRVDELEVLDDPADTVPEHVAEPAAPGLVDPIPPDPAPAPAPPVPAPVSASALAAAGAPAVVAAAAAAPAAPRSRIPRRRSPVPTTNEAPPTSPTIAAPASEVVASPAPVVVAPPAEPAPEVLAAPGAVVGSRRRTRADARAQRTAELSAMFGGEAADADADERHLAEWATALWPAATTPPPTDRRVRRTVAPTDAPDLDVPDPPAPRATAAPARRDTTTTRTRTTDRARRAPTRLPSRPADDRREGGAAVRPRRRGAGQGDRRLPLG